MTAVMRQEIQHDCSANEGGSPAIMAYEIASGIMEIATVEGDKVHDVSDI